MVGIKIGLLANVALQTNATNIGYITDGGTDGCEQTRRVTDGALQTEICRRALYKPSAEQTKRYRREQTEGAF